MGTGIIMLMDENRQTIEKSFDTMVHIGNACLQSASHQKQDVVAVCSN